MVPSARIARRIACCVAALAAAGCNFQPDLAGSEFGCADGGACTSGFICCGDAICRESCDDDAGPESSDASTADAGADAGEVVLCEEAAKAEPPDTCADGDATDITALARAAGGVTLYGDTAQLLNHLATPAANCLGFPLSGAPGSDAIYTLTPDAGEQLDVRLTAPDWDSMVYLAVACTTGAACPEGDVGEFTTAPQPPQQFVHTFPAAGTFYLVVDSARFDYQLDATGCYALEVALTPGG